MKPHQIVLLVAAGALGGALVMKVIQGRAPVEPQPAPVAVAAPAPSPAPVPPPEPVPPVVAQAPEPRPSPLKAPRDVAKPRPTHVAKKAAAIPPPVAEPAPMPIVVAQQPAASPAPEPVTPAPAPQPVPPARPEPEYVTPPPVPPEPLKVTLNAGTLIPVRLVDGLSTERNTPGDLFTASLDKELVVDGLVIAERGARVEGRVVSSDRGGRVNGLASMIVELTRARLSDGQWVALPTETFERRAEPSHRDDAAKIGAGAAIGAVIGAIAGGGKGAAIGAGAGGAAGAGTVAATRGKAATLSSETRLSFRLRSPVTVTEHR